MHCHATQHSKANPLGSGPCPKASVEALKDEARAEMVTYTLGELLRHRELTQTELARRLDRAQASVSAMETAADNLVSTLRMAVEGMGGRLEVTAVFDDERIPLTTHSPEFREVVSVGLLRGIFDAITSQ